MDVRSGPALAPERAAEEAITVATDQASHGGYGRHERHPDFEYEQEVLKKVHSKMQAAAAEAAERLEDCQRRVKELLKKRLADAIDEVLIEQQSAEAQHKGLIESLKRPYFARVDFVRDGAQDKESYYIGIGWFDAGDTKVVNWLSPVAKVFYTHKRSMDTPAGTVKLENILLERQLTVKEDHLLDISDSRNEYLRERLGRSGSERREGVFATLDPDQYDALVSPIGTNMVIQGMAGTGKSVVLLYRLAYVVSEATWSAEELLFLAPNSLLLHQLKGILPEVQVTGVPQMSLREFATRHTSGWIAGDIREVSAVGRARARRAAALEALRFKESREFRTILDRAAERIVVRALSKVGSFRPAPHGKSVGTGFEVHSDRIARWLAELTGYSLERRMSIVRGRLQRLAGDAWETGGLSDERIEAAAERYTSKIREALLGELKDWLARYRKWLARVAAQKGFPRAFTEVTLTDIAAQLYVYAKFVRPERKYRHIVIDEAQAVGPLWVEVLRGFLHDGGSMTLAGDLFQNLNSSSLERWKDLEDQLPGLKVLNLHGAYRVTDEIVDFAAKVLGRHYDITEEMWRKPSRHGRKVGRAVAADDGIVPTVERALALCGRNDSVRHIGIVCWQAKDKQMLTEALGRPKATSEGYVLVDPTRVDSDDSETGAGKATAREVATDAGTGEARHVWLMTLPEAAGLEFDAVIVVTRRFDEEDPLHAKALYTSITRGGHEGYWVNVDPV